MWDPMEADVSTLVCLHTGYVITVASCPVLWLSKLQTKIALSTTKAKYITLLQATWDIIPMQHIIKELGVVCNLKIETMMAHSTIL